MTLEMCDTLSRLKLFCMTVLIQTLINDRSDQMIYHTTQLLKDISTSLGVGAPPSILKMTYLMKSFR